MTELQRIGLLYGTDKTDGNHTFLGESYLDVYDGYFTPIKDTAKVILELGVYFGASLKTWRDYFPTAEVWGVDIDPGRNVDLGERIHVVTGSQVDPEAIAKVAPGQQFDVVVDDGSHLVDHIIRSCHLIWPRLKPGGFYVIEDLGCCYSPDVSMSKECWPGQVLNPPDTDYNNSHERLDVFFNGMIHELDHLRGEVRAIHFHPMQCFIKKV